MALIIDLPVSYSHLSDYLRYLFLFKFGGTCELLSRASISCPPLMIVLSLDLDMDAPWVRSPPNSNLEFIGADYATLASDLDWTLDEDGMYLAPGVMRFRKGWNLFRDIMENAFSITYPVDCFNCVGPRAITLGVKANRRRLELNGFTILPSQVLYPKNWITSHELVIALPPGEAKTRLAEIIQGSWSIHLFGKMTNHLRIQSGSVVGEAFEAFSLKIPRKAGYLSTADRELGNSIDLGQGLDLRLPENYTYLSRLSLQTAEVPNLALLGSVDGRFDGLDLIYIRGTKTPRAEWAKIAVSTRIGGRVGFSSSSARIAGRSRDVDGSSPAVSEVLITLRDATLRDVNAVLGTLTYSPGSQHGEDEVKIEVEFGEEVARGSFVVAV